MNETQVAKINELLDNASFLITHFKSLKDDVNATNQEFLVELNTKVDELKAQFGEFLTTQTHLSKNEIANLVKNSLDELNTLSVDIKNELNKLILGINTDALAIKFSGTQRPQNIENAKINDVYLDKSAAMLYVCVDPIKQLWLNEKELYSQKTYYPKPAELGFGVAVNHAAAARCGLTPLIGCDEPSSENFGNYKDIHESVFVCIPKFYYKINNAVTVPELAPRREVLVSYDEKPGYAIPYAFKKSDGTYVECVFVSKYQLSNSLGVDASGGIAVSKKGLAPLSNQPYSSSSQYNSISRLKGSPADTNAGFFKAVRSAGEQYCMHYAPLRFAYWLLCEAHIQASIKKYSALNKVPKEICAFLDVAPFYPKGCNDNALKDTNDQSVSYKASGYSQKGLCGAITNFAKTTHNGQNCGIADLNGNMWEVDAGFIRNNNDFYLLKGIDLLKTLNETNVNDVKNYVSFAMSNRLDNAKCYVGDGANPIFDGATSGNEYLADNTLRTLDSARSSTGLDAYGKDYQYVIPSGNVPLFGGHWDNASGAGILYCNNSGSWASYSSSCGVRALLIP